MYHKAKAVRGLTLLKTDIDVEHPSQKMIKVDYDPIETGDVHWFSTYVGLSQGINQRWGPP